MSARRHPGPLISIHSPRMGRDRLADVSGYAEVGISIHSPRMGRDAFCHCHDPGGHISIHSPRMGRDQQVVLLRLVHLISIHSPRMGRDSSRTTKSSAATAFQSTLPAWGETEGIEEHSHRRHISIHSPRMGRDCHRVKFVSLRINFNPLSPHGERPFRSFQLRTGKQFQSTLPAWGETSYNPHPPDNHPISIHSPRMGRDHPHVSPLRSSQRISIHSPRMGRDPTASFKPSCTSNFNPLSPHGERRTHIQGHRFPEQFQSTLPAWGETDGGACMG